MKRKLVPTEAPIVEIASRPGPRSSRVPRDAERTATPEATRRGSVASAILRRAAALPGGPITPAHILVLQRSIGNRAVGALLAHRGSPPSGTVQTQKVENQHDGARFSADIDINFNDISPVYNDLGMSVRIEPASALVDAKNIEATGLGNTDDIEEWEVGFVQNVIYDRVEMKYEDPIGNRSATFIRSLPGRCLDASGASMWYDAGYGRATLCASEVEEQDDSDSGSDSGTFVWKAKQIGIMDSPNVKPEWNREQLPLRQTLGGPQFTTYFVAYQETTKTLVPIAETTWSMQLNSGVVTEGKKRKVVPWGWLGGQLVSKPARSNGNPVVTGPVANGLATVKKDGS